MAVFGLVPGKQSFAGRAANRPGNAFQLMLELALRQGGRAMSALKLTQIGNSVGVILPKELLAKLGVGKGDTLYAIDQPDGVKLTVAHPEFEAQMEVAREVMKRRYNVLRELAK
jgi:putative addiction module antidote